MRRQLDDFAEASQTGTMDEYNMALDFLLDDEEMLNISLQIQAATMGQSLSEFDRDRRGRQLTTAYPYGGPDLTRR